MPELPTIAAVRAAYRALANRCTERSPDQAGYVHDLWTMWDQVLATLTDADLQPHTVWHLTRTISDPRLTDDAALEWLDAYPAGITEHITRAQYMAQVLDA